MTRKDTVTLPKALAKLLVRAAYWPSHRADLAELLPDAEEDLVEGRIEDLDSWLVSIGMPLAPDMGSDRMLLAVLAAWTRGSRPGGKP